ncbi:hypothetical protein F4823DRAFT_569177 [Ustulina deusta]|nr:hypothetical protein F4823DRAFT_569177 [Ustulina deusta]
MRYNIFWPVSPTFYRISISLVPDYLGPDRRPQVKGTRLILDKLDATAELDAADAIKELKTKNAIDHLDVVIANAGVVYIWPTVANRKIDDMLASMRLDVFGVIWLYQARRHLLNNAASPKWSLSVRLYEALGKLRLDPITCILELYSEQWNMHDTAGAFCCVSVAVPKLLLSIHCFALNCKDEAESDVGMLAVDLSAEAALPYPTKYDRNAFIACFDSPCSLTTET